MLRPAMSPAVAETARGSNTRSATLVGSGFPNLFIQTANSEVFLPLVSLFVLGTDPEGDMNPLSTAGQMVRCKNYFCNPDRLLSPRGDGYAIGLDA
jgi:hypothetical protein